MIAEIIGETELKYLIGLVLALLCGLIIGSERELKRKPAGISTQSLVVTASMTFAFLSTNLGLGEPTRIAAQIVSGIGFLGAGLILKSEKDERISNVTTAASIWYSAAVGMALGFGFYFIGVIAALQALIISSIPHINKRDGV